VQITAGDATSTAATNGHINNFRIVKGTAVYTSAFTPPTEPLTAISGTSLLTCQSNRFVDNSSNAHAITVNGDTKVVPFSPFAPSTAYDPATKGGSGYFDGSGDWLLTSASSDLALGTGEFTIECFYYSTGITRGNLFSTKPASGSDSSAIGIYFFDDGVNVWNDGSMINVTKAADNQWIHLAVTRDSSNLLTLWLNGSSAGTSSNFTANLTRDTLAIGALTSGGEILNGPVYISDLRAVKGTALYTSAFTPPTAPLTDVTNTSLLCNFTNASIVDETGRNVIETVGNAQIDTAVKKYGCSLMGRGIICCCLPLPTWQWEREILRLRAGFTLLPLITVPSLSAGQQHQTLMATQSQLTPPP